jgi:hypothetical protein
VWLEWVHLTVIVERGPFHDARYKR